MSEGRLRDAARELLQERPELESERIPYTGHAKGFYYSKKIFKLILQQYLKNKNETIRGVIDENNMLAIEEYYASLPDE